MEGRGRPAGPEAAPLTARAHEIGLISDTHGLLRPEVFDVFGKWIGSFTPETSATRTFSTSCPRWRRDRGVG